MNNAKERIIRSSQEQAVASWITYLNQHRLNEFIERLNKQDLNLEEAMKELEELKQFLGNPSQILGNPLTKHGEIAEHMQVNIVNARRAIQGLSKNHTFDGVGRTAPEDYLRDGLQVQSKFYNGLNNTFFGNHALKEHLEKYPDFIKNGGSYDIPKDQYNKMVEVLEKYRNSPSDLSTSDYNIAKKIDEFLKDNGLEIGKDVNPAVVDYRDVQQGNAHQTVADEEKRIKDENQKQRQEAYDESRPSLKEGAKAAGVAATIEGGISFCMSMAAKRKEKNFSEFSADDWKEIGIDTGKGAAKGGIRGASIYALSNFTATPANVASAYVTAAFGIASQVKALDEGRVSKEDFVINCETVCLDVTISAIASVAGQVLIPVPVLGAVVGNVAGEFIYELCKNQASIESQRIITSYHSDVDALNKKLDSQYMKVVYEIQQTLHRFQSLEELVFSEDVNIAFNNSIDLAIEVGVPKEKILKTPGEVSNYFLS